ncbi:hypothetical protein LINPERHAP2_LOCUS41761 [Linum perenne]
MEHSRMCTTLGTSAPARAWR